MKYLCLLLACIVLVGCPARPNGLVAPEFYLVVEKIEPNIVVVWTREEVHRIELMPAEYKQVYVGQTGLVPVVWAE